MEIKTAFGLTIRKIRLEKSLSQENLSEFSGLDVSFISLIENGKKQPSLTTIIKLAEGFNLPPSEIFIEMEKLKFKRSV